MSLCKFLSLLAVLSLGTVGHVAAEEREPQVLVRLRFCQGDPAKPNSLKVLSAPSVLTVSGQPANVVIGAEHASAEGEPLVSGIECSIKPTVRKDGRVAVEVDFSSTQPVPSKDAEAVTVQGTCLRSHLVTTPNKTQRLGGLKQGDEQVWLELTTEIVKPGEVE